MADYEYNVLMVGESSVGKSCFVLRATDDTYNDNFISTIGVNHKDIDLNHDSKSTKLRLWDTCGQDKFGYIETMKNMKCHAVVISYDVTDQVTFDRIKTWYNDIKRYANESTLIILTGNKCDNESERAVSYEEGKELAELLGIDFFETSAKENINCTKVIEYINETLKNRRLTNVESKDLSNENSNETGKNPANFFRSVFNVGKGDPRVDQKLFESGYKRGYLPFMNQGESQPQTKALSKEV